MARLWERMKAEFVEEVPEEIAFCEFNCHKAQCTEKEWQTCPLRLAMAAGKLVPARKANAAEMVGSSH